MYVLILNLPGMADYTCIGECSWTRTVKSVLPFEATYTASVEGDFPEGAITVTPLTFTLGAGEEAELTISVNAFQLPLGEYTFANLVLSTEAVYTPDPITLLSQDFQSSNFPPSGWADYNVDGYSESDTQWGLSSTNQGHNSTLSALHAGINRGGSGGEQDGWLVTPAFEPAENTELKFWERADKHNKYIKHSLWVCTGNCAVPAGNWAEILEFGQLPNKTWREQTVDLSAYQGQTIQLAFRYQGNNGDDWYIDDISITDTPAPIPVPSQHFPIAVVSAAGSAPDKVNIDTRRDAGSIEVDGLLALETNDLTFREFGLVEAEFILDEINPDEYVGWLLPVTANTKRLVTEIIETTSIDLDLYVGMIDADGIQLPTDAVCISATATAYEKCDLLDPTPGNWFAFIHNYTASSTPPDLYNLSIGLVPGTDAGNLTASGPVEVEYKVPFSVQLSWNEPNLEEGDIYYGAFDLGLDSANAGNIGTVRVNLNRFGDDVTKTVSKTEAFVGDELTYTINIKPDLTGEELTYTITDSLPAGLTYIPGSAAPEPTINENTLMWTVGVIDEPVEISYKATVDKVAHGTELTNQVKHLPDIPGSLEETASVKVTVLNTAPELGEIGNKTVDELAELAFTASAVDNEDDDLAYSIEGLPEGAEFDPETGAFSWTPSEAQGPDEYEVKIIVSDGDLDDEEEFTITVNEVNAAPVLALIGDQTGTVGTAVTFTASATDEDLPENDLTFSLKDAPEGAVIDPETGAFSWTPTEVGEFYVTVLVDDGSGAENATDEETITISVPNTAPVLVPIGDQEIDELETLEFTATATDIEDDRLTFSIEGLPEGAEFDPETGDFSWTPSEAQGPGVYEIEITLSDGDQEDEEEFTITVNEVNAAPVLALIGDRQVTVGETVSFTASATDEDLPPNILLFSLKDAPEGAVIDPETGAFSWTPTEVDEFYVTVLVDDGSGAENATDEETITITVSEIVGPQVILLYLPIIIK